MIFTYVIVINDFGSFDTLLSYAGHVLIKQLGPGSQCETKLVLCGQTAVLILINSLVVLGIDMKPYSLDKAYCTQLTKLLDELPKQNNTKTERAVYNHWNGLEYWNDTNFTEKCFDNVTILH